MNSLTSQASAISGQLKTQSLNAVIGGFSFASAIAWMDAIRWLLSQVISVKSNGGQYYLLTALLTTLLAVIAFTVINALDNGKRTQPNVMYAVTR